MFILLFDNSLRDDLYPFSQTKAIADLRYGIFTIKERWEAISGLPVFINTTKNLSKLYAEPAPDECLCMDASVKDDDALRARILSLQHGEALYDDAGFIACRFTYTGNGMFINENAKHIFTTILNYDGALRLQYPWQLFQWNDEQLRRDFLLLFARSATQPVSSANTLINPENILIEDSAVVEHCIINASNGPVYIAKNATVMEGSILRGPVAICENATIKAGAKIYGATTIGAHCTAGGEIKNSILQSYSNKAHDGYLGDSVIGSWCNLGGGTSNSNIKNSGGSVHVWNPSSNKTINAGKKCGMFMGDYSRTAINTSVNTGTVIGVCCNVFCEGLTPKFIDDFTWGSTGKSNYDIDKAITHIINWKALKAQTMSSEEEDVLRALFKTKQ